MSTFDYDQNGAGEHDRAVVLMYEPLWQVQKKTAMEIYEKTFAALQKGVTKDLILVYVSGAMSSRRDLNPEATNMQSHGFAHAAEGAVSNCPFPLDKLDWCCCCPPSNEIHVYRVKREAGASVSKSVSEKPEEP